MCSTSAPCAASVRPQTGPAITRVASSTRMPCSGRAARGGRGVGGAVADPLQPHRRQARHRLALRMRVPFGEAAHGGDAHARPRPRPARRRSPPSRAAPPPPRRGCPRSPAAAARRRGGAGNWCAAGPSGHRRSDRCRRCRPSAPAPPLAEPQVALGAEFQRGVAHLDRGLLRRAAAPAVDLRRRRGRRGDPGLRRGADAEGGGQRRLRPRQRGRGRAGQPRPLPEPVEDRPHGAGLRHPFPPAPARPA